MWYPPKKNCNLFNTDKYYESLVNAFVNGEEADDIQTENAYYGLKLTKTFVCKSAADLYDFTGDGEVDMLDLIRQKNIALGKASSAGPNPDLDDSGNVDATDLIFFKKYLFKTI